MPHLIAKNRRVRFGSIEENGQRWLRAWVESSTETGLVEVFRSRTPYFGQLLRALRRRPPECWEVEEITDDCLLAHVEVYGHNLYGLHLTEESGPGNEFLSLWAEQYRIEFALELAAFFERCDAQRLRALRRRLHASSDGSDPYEWELPHLRGFLDGWQRTRR